MDVSLLRILPIANFVVSKSKFNKDSFEVQLLQSIRNFVHLYQKQKFVFEDHFLPSGPQFGCDILYGGYDITL